MTTISMPAAPNFRRSRFGLETNTGQFESPFNRAVQRQEFDGARWVLTVTLPRMNRQQFAPWQAFLLQLKGRVNSFYGFDPDAKYPRGPATGTPLVNGGSQTGNSLTIDGCTANVTNWMYAGDYFGVGGELKMLSSNVSTNGSGQATLTFFPKLKSSPADNAAVTVNNPSCAMILADDMQSAWEADHNGIYQELTFSGVEAFS